MAWGLQGRIDESLGPDEHVVMWRRPDWLAWLFDQTLDVGSVLVCVLITAASWGGRWFGVSLLATVGLAGSVAVRLLVVLHTGYVLTTHRAMYFSGVLRRDLEYMTWSKVTDVSVERSLADRLTGTATILIHSANEQSSFKALRDVANPLVFAAAITEQVNLRQGPPKSSAPAPPAVLDAAGPVEE